MMKQRKGFNDLSITWYGPYCIMKLKTLSCWTRIYPAFANSVDPDQLASEEANWSGSMLFAIQYLTLSKTWIKLSDWLKIRSGHGILIYSAWQGLITMKGSMYNNRSLWLKYVWKHFIQYLMYSIQVVLMQINTTHFRWPSEWSVVLSAGCVKESIPAGQFWVHWRDMHRLWVWKWRDHKLHWTHSVSFISYFWAGFCMIVFGLLAQQSSSG